MPDLRRTQTREIAIVSSFSSIYTVFRLIPFAKLVGMPGFLTASSFVAPALGVLLSPSNAIVAVAIGTTIAFAAPWHPVKFLGLDFVPGAMYVLVAGLIVRGRRVEAASAFAILLALFLYNPNTRLYVGENLGSPPIPYPWLYFVVLGVLVSPLTLYAERWIRSNSLKQISQGMVILSLIGAVTEHLAGGILTAIVFGQGAVAFWPAIFLLYPWERALIVAAATIICTPLVLRLRNVVFQQPARLSSS